MVTAEPGPGGRAPGSGTGLTAFPSLEARARGVSPALPGALPGHWDVSLTEGLLAHGRPARVPTPGSIYAALKADTHRSSVGGGKEGRCGSSQTRRGAWRAGGWRSAPARKVASGLDGESLARELPPRPGAGHTLLHFVLVTTCPVKIATCTSGRLRGDAVNSGNVGMPHTTRHRAGVWWGFGPRAVWPDSFPSTLLFPGCSRGTWSGRGHSPQAEKRHLQAVAVCCVDRGSLLKHEGPGAWGLGWLSA